MWWLTSITMILQPVALVWFVGLVGLVVFVGPLFPQEAVPAAWTVPWLLALLAVIPAWALGPLWRMKMLTAAGLALAARARDRENSSMLAGAVDFGFTILQALVFAFVMMGFVVTGFKAVELGHDMRWWALLIWPAAVVALAWVPRVVYVRQQRRFEQLALKWMTRD